MIPHKLTSKPRLFPHFASSILRASSFSCIRSAINRETVGVIIHQRPLVPVHRLSHIESGDGRPSYPMGWLAQSDRSFSSAPNLPRQTSPELSHDENIIILLQHRKKFKEIGKLLKDIFHNDRKTPLKLSTFDAILYAISKTKHRNAGNEAEWFLDLMMEFYRAGRLDQTPTIEVFGIVIRAWVHSKHPFAGKRAEAVLDEIERMNRHGILPLTPNTVTYTSVMQAYVKQGDALKAQNIYQRMLQDYQKGNAQAKPDVYCLSTLINAHAQSGHPDAGSKAEEILTQMGRDYKNGLLDQKPNAYCYCAAIKAYAKLGNGHKAEVLLKRMYSDHKNNNNQNAQPDAETFAAVLNAWAQSGMDDAGKRAEAVLKSMIQLYEDGTLPHVRPDVVCYSTVIGTYAKAGYPAEADRLLEQMCADYQRGNTGARPTVNTFNAVIDGWLKSSDSIQDAGDRAEAVLNRIQKLYQQQLSNVRPDAYTYNAVLKAFAERGNGESAQNVFERMVQDYQSGNTTAKPKHATFCAMMKAWSISGLPEAGQKADDLLNRMPDFHLKPNISTHVSAFRCWTQSKEHPRRNERVQQLQKELQKLDKTRSMK